MGWPVPFRRFETPGAAVSSFRKPRPASNSAKELKRLHRRATRPAARELERARGDPQNQHRHQTRAPWPRQDSSDHLQSFGGPARTMQQPLRAVALIRRNLAGDVTSDTFAGFSCHRAAIPETWTCGDNASGAALRSLGTERCPCASPGALTLRPSWFGGRRT